VSSTSIRLASVALTTILLTVASKPAQSYRLSPHRISTDEQSVPAEVSLKKYESQIEKLRDVAPVGVIENHRRNYKTRFSQKGRSMVRGFTQIRRVASFWQYTVDLKSKLIGLHHDTNNSEMCAEADALAKAIVQKLYDISQEYSISVSAIVNNILINTGIKEKGFCYHYVEDLMKILREREWRFFDIHWGEAWAGTFRENNALVITGKGSPFETGLAIDSWRSAGKPFWTKVEGDRYPWVEAVDLSQ
jgi:hypothetical protein